jgi:hypothetical protein
MFRGGFLVALAMLVIGSAASAQQPARLRWQSGQVLVYKIEHTTLASDQVGDVKNETRSSLKVTRRWQVTGVGAGGVATLQMSLPALMQERTTPSGEVLRYDSADPAKSTPQLKEVFARFVNTPLALVRIDGLGKVVEVKESKFGHASSFENELPFVAVLPPGGLKVGQTWERAFQITLAPPVGTGEKYAAVQRYSCKAIEKGRATLTLTTELKAEPKVPADAIPLWQMLPQGEVVFDLTSGRLEGATLKIDKELKGYQGENSVCRFQSMFTIRYAGDR